MIKITKQAIGATGGSYVRLYLSPSYLTNGHWAVARTAIDPRMNSVDALQTICTSVDEKTDDFIAKAIKPGVDAIRPWTVSGWLFETSAKARTFARVAVADDGARMYLDEAYCKAFGLTAGSVVYAADQDSVVRVKGDDPIFLMPRRSPGAELPAAPAGKAPTAGKAPRARKAPKAPTVDQGAPPSSPADQGADQGAGVTH